MNIEIGYRALGQTHYDSLEAFTGTMAEALAHAKNTIKATRTGTIFRTGSTAAVVSVKTNQIAELREV